jgi:predicted hotdog family 3-hydroxylacyl-ACP dehydratase
MNASHPTIAELIPHHGAMCLLDTIETWDERHIRCAAQSHHRLDNPLRDATGLRTVCAIEYGAQAMAAHAALLGNPGAHALATGLLVAAREIVMAGSHLDGIVGPLTILAEVVLINGNGRIYNVTVTGDGRTLLSGRLSVMIAPANHARPLDPPGKRFR